MRYLIVLLLFTACANTSSLFSAGKKLGHVHDNRLEEISGLVASRANEGFLWVHNDSGNEPAIYLVDRNLDIKMICKLDGAQNVDWEDIATGAGPDPGRNYLFIGDIGDNLAQRPYKIIYRLAEPVLDKATPANREIVVRDFDTILFKLEGEPKDTEALIVDPVTRNIYLFAKRERPATVYELRLSNAGVDTLVARKAVTLPIKKIVAADLSPDGNELLIKNYGHIYYWNRREGGIVQSLAVKPLRLKYRRELQGEAIGWNKNANGFYTVGEKPFWCRTFLFYHKRD